MIVCHFHFILEIRRRNSRPVRHSIESTNSIDDDGETNGHARSEKCEINEQTATRAINIELVYLFFFIIFKTNWHTHALTHKNGRNGQRLPIRNAIEFRRSSYPIVNRCTFLFVFISFYRSFVRFVACIFYYLWNIEHEEERKCHPSYRTIFVLCFDSISIHIFLSIFFLCVCAIKLQRSKICRHDIAIQLFCRE